MIDLHKEERKERWRDGRLKERKSEGMREE